MVRIVDLSVTIENNMPAHKNMPRPVYLEWMTHDSCARLAQGVPGNPFTTPIEARMWMPSSTSSPVA
jgi:hypothetical protein